MKKLWYVCMLLTVCLVGCNKTDDLWDDVNEFKDSCYQALEKTGSRFELEHWSRTLNICKEGATITNIELKDGIYTITLSNGKTLKLVEETEPVPWFLKWALTTMVIGRSAMTTEALSHNWKIKAGIL